MANRLSVLWVSHFVPYPPVGGVYQRSFNLLRAVAEKHDVHLVAIRHKSAHHGGVTHREAEAALTACCASVRVVDLSRGTAPGVLHLRAATALTSRDPFTVRMMSSAQFRDAISECRRATNPAVALFDSISVAQYQALMPEIGTALVHHNIESWMIQRRTAFEKNPLAKWYYSVECRRLERYERRTCPHFTSNVVVSDADRELLQRIVPGTRIDVVENGVDTDYFAPGPLSDDPTLVFAGRLDQYANRRGINDFLDNIWPVLRQTYPQLGFKIIGLNPPADLQQRASADSGVTVIGFVPDLRVHMRNALAVVIPLRDGGGTRLKVLDAMALGLPIVATEVALEGLNVEAGRDVLVANDAMAFVTAIGQLLASRDLRETLARHARQVVEQRYSWRLLGSKLQSLLLELAETRGSAPARRGAVHATQYA